MAVTVTWIEFNGSQSAWPALTRKRGPGQLGISGSYPLKNLNFGSADSPNIVASYYPIPAGSNSYAKYVKLQFSGAFTTVSNLKFWMSNGALKTGESILFSGSVIKHTTAPSQTSIATTHPGTGSFYCKAIPTSAPTYPNVCSQGTTASTLPIPSELRSTPGYYSGVRASAMALQLLTTTSIEAGAVNTKTFSVIYDRT